MELNKKAFIRYKLLNSSFTGLSIGILFTIYTPLDPAIYSIGGILLAIGMLVIAKFYESILNIRSFFIISLLVEIVMLLTILIFLILKYSLTSALLIYIGYQFTFIFGNYLVRAETLVAKEKEYLGRIDISKQIGYIIGLCLSFMFYKALEYSFDITDNKDQINILHYFLISLQVTIVIFLINSFKNINLSR